jgi:hypothetical protein
MPGGAAGSGLWGATVRSAAERLEAALLGDTWMKKGDTYQYVSPREGQRAARLLSSRTMIIIAFEFLIVTIAHGEEVSI